VNVEGRGATTAEAAAWVEYANGPANSKYGAMRAANGHPEPFRVKYWEVGNEIWGRELNGTKKHEKLTTKKKTERKKTKKTKRKRKKKNTNELNDKTRKRES